DTGKAALEGFRDAPHTRIFVFYPDTGVSPMQKLQMATQEGNNVGVFAIRGNFDDAQNGVKAIFTDPDTGALLQSHGKRFSSANSINWGRLVPQIVYYVSAYCDLVKSGALLQGEPMNVVVPTGNFGNILAAYYAKQMGIPIARLICASNRNRVLTDFFETGVYDRRRDFYVTSSPSMDILISSNLERLLFDLSGRDDAAVRGWMEQLVATGTYTVSAEVKRQMDALFAAGTCDEKQTAETIGKAFRDHGYLLDTHSAVAVRVYEDYRARTGDTTPTVIASTASPYKFPASVLGALGQAASADELDCADKLHEVTGVEIPAPLANLRGKQPRFTDVCTKDEMRARVLDALGIAE
ncbi:MAG: threonine synthase, partial [Clostridia bacterium]|nr:threonine synthase [Clostridia bacterium]